MPSTMIHLLTAYKYNPNASAAFWVGNVAPDSIYERKEKDKSHLRDRPDRAKALEEFALSMDLKDDLNQGIIMHLYLDYCWDIDPMHNFIQNYKEGFWFPVYRNEIALAGAWLYHHVDWSKKIWDEMLALPMSAYEHVQGLKKEAIFDFIERNSKWHAESNIGPSSAFPPDFVEEFSSKAAVDFKNWFNKIINKSENKN